MRTLGVAILAGNGMLVHGLKDPRVHSDGDWRELLTAVLHREWPTPTPHEDTRKAEAGLGIQGSPYYFYAMRTHEAYDFVVFAMEESPDMPFGEGAEPRGATPFDSGGLWKGKIHLFDSAGAPSDIAEQRRQVFSENDVPLHLWQSKFREYLDKNYSSLEWYVEGRPPLHGTESVINAKPPNEERAWTWEVRYPVEFVSSKLCLRHVFMHPYDLADYINWLPSRVEKLGATRTSELTDWVRANVTVSDSPGAAVESMLHGSIQ